MFKTVKNAVSSISFQARHCFRRLELRNQTAESRVRSMASPSQLTSRTVALCKQPQEGLRYMTWKAWLNLKAKRECIFANEQKPRVEENMQPSQE